MLILTNFYASSFLFHFQVYTKISNYEASWLSNIYLLRFMGLDFWYWHIIFTKGQKNFHHLRLFHIRYLDICFGKQGRNWICIPFIIFAVQSTCIMFGLHIYDYNGIMHFTKTWQKPWMDKNIFECNEELSSWGHYRNIFHNNDQLGLIYIGYNTFVCFYCGYENVVVYFRHFVFNHSKWVKDFILLSVTINITFVMS